MNVAKEIDCAALAIDLKKTKAPTIYEPVGCDSCNGIGYKGRMGVYELVLVDEKLRTMIHDGVSEQKLEAYARKSTPGIADEGRRLVLSGATSIEEILRVTRED